MWVEAFMAEGKTYIDITCLLCSRVWPLKFIEQILAPLREKGYTRQMRHLILDVNKEVSRIPKRSLVL